MFYRVDFAIPADYRLKIKENETKNKRKKDKYFYRAGELKKLWNIKVSMISISVIALEGLENKDWRSEDESRLSRQQYC